MTGSKPLFLKIGICRAIVSAENDRSHAEISFHIYWWGSWALGPGDFRSDEKPVRLLTDFGHSKIQEPNYWAPEGPIGPHRGLSGPVGP